MKSLLEAEPLQKAGNKTLREKFLGGINQRGDDALYWRIRAMLIERGDAEQGRGKGGSVHLVPAAAQPPAVPAPPTAPPPARPAVEPTDEARLYTPCRDAIETGWAGDHQLSEPVVAITAKKVRGGGIGKWSVPDVTLVAVRGFEFLPPQVEVTTFEIKPKETADVDGAFEAAAHTYRSHRAYLLMEIEDEDEFETQKFDRLKAECLRFGVGLLTFTNANDYDTWEEHVEARYHDPDPSEVDDMIRRLLDEEPRNRVRDAIRRRMAEAATPLAAPTTQNGAGQNAATAMGHN